MYCRENALNFIIGFPNKLSLKEKINNLRRKKEKFIGKG